MKKKYLLIIEYEGTAYHGWQMQKNGVSVQELVEKALTKITKTKICQDFFKQSSSKSLKNTGPD